VILLTINGQSHSFANAPTVFEMLARLELVARRIAVERNGEIIPRSQFDTTTLNADDHIEIVVAVGGG
jgi:sulfur carrier protein